MEEKYAERLRELCEHLQEVLTKYRQVIENLLPLDAMSDVAPIGTAIRNSVFSLQEIGTDGEGPIRWVCDVNDVSDGKTVKQNYEKTLSLKTDIIPILRNISEQPLYTYVYRDKNISKDMRRICEEYDNVLKRIKKEKAAQLLREKRTRSGSLSDVPEKKNDM